MIDRKRKLVFIFTLTLVVAFTGLSCAEDIPRVVVQSPPTVAALPLLWVMESEALADQLELHVRISPDHQRGLALLAQNDIEMLITGVNVGVKAFNKGIDVRLVNTNIWGIDYLLTGDFTAQSWSDLEGKSLSLPLQGGPLDFLARYFLSSNGVDLEKVTFVYQASNNGAKMFQLGKVDAIILPEPLVTITMKNYAEAALSFDLQEEWGKLHSGEERIPFVGLFIRGDLVENNPKLIELVSTYYQIGMEWVKNNPYEASVLGAEYFNQPAPVIHESFKRINLNLYPHHETRELIELYFGEIMGLYPEMIGGKLPDEHFYLQTD